MVNVSLSNRVVVQTVDGSGGKLSVRRAIRLVTKAKSKERRKLLIRIGESRTVTGERFLMRELREGRAELACAAIGLSLSRRSKVAKELMTLAQSGRTLAIRRCAASALVYCRGVNTLQLMRAASRLVASETEDSCIRSTMLEAIGNWLSMGRISRGRANMLGVLRMGLEQKSNPEVRATAAFVCGQLRYRTVTRALKQVAAADRRPAYGVRVSDFARQALLRMRKGSASAALIAISQSHPRDSRKIRKRAK